MEDAILNAINSGNATSALCALLVYLVVSYQRKQTGMQRDADKELMKKDIEDLRRRADSTDSHFTKVEEQLAEISKQLVKLCTLIEMHQKQIDNIENTDN